MNNKLFLFIVSLFVFLSAYSFVSAAFERDLYFGMVNDPDVTILQNFLTAQGVYSGPVTGNFFTLTKEGVVKFQKREGIEPSAGYFGPKTRARANALMSQAPSSIESIRAKINELRAKLLALQNQPPSVSSTSVSVEDTTPPVFTKRPAVSQAGFVSNPPFGAHYPYRVVFDWSVDDTGFLTETVTCSPALKIAKPAGRLTEYYPEPRTSYSCGITVKDQAGNPVSADLSFNTPSWVSVSGVQASSSFPDIATSPLKIGEITLYNGTTSDVLFTSFETRIYDQMDSTLNRGRKVYFVLRNGVSSADALISKKDFTFLTLAPISSPNISVLSLPIPVVLAPGEEKKISLWVEQLDYVRSGILEIKTDSVQTTSPSDSVSGSFDFILTKSPPL